MHKQQHGNQPKADQGRQGQRGGQAQVLSEQQLKASNGQRQQEIKRPAFTLANNRIEPQQQGNQGNQINHQTDQTGDGELNGTQPQLALLGTAKISNDQ